MVQEVAPVVEQWTTQSRMCTQLPTPLRAGLPRGRLPTLGSLLELAQGQVEGPRQQVLDEAIAPPSLHLALPL